jgi:hypothetical protein
MTQSSTRGPSAPSSWRQPRRRWLAGAAVLVAAAVSVTVTVLLSDTSARNPRAPFIQALTNLAVAPSVTQRGRFGSQFAYDVRVTRYGEMTGTMTLPSMRMQVLAVGGVRYLKTASGALPGGGAAQLPASLLKDEWIKADDTMLGGTTSQIGTPADLATRLRRLITQSATTFPAGKVQVNGTPAFVAHTAIGDLFVSTGSPHRVLRFGQRTGPDTPSLPSLPALPSLPTLPSLPGHSLRHGDLAGMAEPVPQSGAGGVDIVTQSIEQALTTYDDIDKEVKHLQDVVDTKLDAQVIEDPLPNCSRNGCVPTVAVRVKADKSESLKGGVRMKAGITLNGEEAGTCISPPVPIAATNLPVILSCVDAEAGPIYSALFSAQESELRKHAGGTAEVISAAKVTVYGRAYVDIDKEVADLKKEIAQIQKDTELQLPR